MSADLAIGIAVGSVAGTIAYNALGGWHFVLRLMKWPTILFLAVCWVPPIARWLMAGFFVIGLGLGVGIGTQL